MAGVQCCVPAPPAHHASGGVVETWGAISVYINKSGAASKAVILVSDVMGAFQSVDERMSEICVVCIALKRQDFVGFVAGWEAPLLRKLADKIASVGYVVVVPDYFHGDAFKLIEGDVVQDRLQEWLPKHLPTPEPVEESKQIIGVLKEKGVESIGVAGFCWGGKVAVVLAKEDVQAAVLLHPSLLTSEDIKEVKVPIAILGAETDEYTPPALIKEFEEILISKSKVPHFVKIFPGVSHGWTVRYELNDEKAIAAAEESHSNLLEWFGKYL